MHLKSFMRKLRLLTIIFPLIALAGCWGNGSGPSSTPDAKAPPRPPQPPPVELLTNPGFEEPDASDGDIACSFSWDCFNSSFTNSNLFDDGNGGPAAYLGTQILKQFGNDGGAFQDVTAIPGQPYTASAWAQNWSGDPLNRLVILQLFFYDSDGVQIADNETFGTPINPPGGQNQTYLPPDTWVELSIERFSPEKTATARIQVIHLGEDTNQTGNPGGSVFWDNMSLTGPGSSPEPPPAGVDLLSNGTFEASTGGCAESWTCFESVNAVPTDDGQGNFAPVSHDVGGFNSLKMFGPFQLNPNAAGAYQVSNAVIAGQTYEASIWVMNWEPDTLTNIGILQLNFFDGADATGNNLGQFEVTVDSTLTPLDQNISLAPQDGAEISDWTELSITQLAPAGTVSASIFLLHIQTDPVSGGSIFWDDASLIGPSSDVPDGFTLKFFDEFNDDGPVSPDPEKWTMETGIGPPTNDPGWGNNEWQAYTTDLNNVRVEDGNLVIQARCVIAPCVTQDGSITSGKINSQDKFEFQYGIVRGRIKAPGGFAAWPAFWMLGSVFPITPWPNAGEMDIMELFQNNSSPFETHSTIHFCNDSISFPADCNFDNGYDFITDSKDSTEKWSDDFHIYELEWNADTIIMRVDGDEVFNNVINPAFMEEFRNSFYLILNVAMGGNAGPGGNQPPDQNVTFVETMLVDWVRVYQAIP